MTTASFTWRLITKQPNANTLDVTQEVEKVLQTMKATLPPDVVIETKAFQQAAFIERAIENVKGALAAGGILVAVVLFLFLWNFRTTFISLTAPLSLATAVITMTYFGISINTMTLGGLAIAIGELVDDAIIDVENVFRRLRENTQSTMLRPIGEVIFRASSEIRNSIVFATLIIILVFLPLFNPGGFEGRMFAPLAFTYIASIAASLVVALTVTPALSYYLLGQPKFLKETGESKLVRGLKRWYSTTLEWTLRHPGPIIGLSAMLLIAAIMLIPLMGREFLPPFNEGALNINISLPPGTSLQESNRIGQIAEDTLHRTPEVVSTTRRTGRAELDEHAAGVNASEIEVVTRSIDRPQAAIMEEVRLSQVASIREDQGPNTINRENVQRRIIIQANVAGRDLGSVIDDVRARIGRGVALPRGYFFSMGGNSKHKKKPHAKSRQCPWSRLPEFFFCSIWR